MTRAVCGTNSGYNRHILDGEKACDACRLAHNDTNRPITRARGKALTLLAQRYPDDYDELRRTALREVGGQ